MRAGRSRPTRPGPWRAVPTSCWEASRCQSGATLTIQPGVEVRFNGNFALNSQPTFSGVTLSSSNTIIATGGTRFHCTSSTPAFTSAGGTTFVPNSLDQYTSVGGAAYTYDLAGNLTSDGVRTFGYDAENRLTSASGPSLTATYGYDALGRRIRKTVNGTKTLYVHDGEQILQELNAAEVVQAVYRYGFDLDQPLTMRRNNVPHWYLTEPIGTVTAIADAAGNVVESYRYDAFGEVAIFDGAGAPLAASAVGNSFLVGLAESPTALTR